MLFSFQEIAGVFRNLRKVELRLRSEYEEELSCVFFGGVCWDRILLGNLMPLPQNSGMGRGMSSPVTMDVSTSKLPNVLYNSPPAIT